MKISNTKLIEKLYQTTTHLMQQTFNLIESGESGVEKIFYDKVVHKFLQFERIMPHIYSPREIYLPLPQEEWPNRFKSLFESFDSHITWPYHTTGQYVSDKLMPPMIPDLLYAGYAIYEGVLVPCTFFVAYQMTEQDLGDAREMLPEIFVVDPLAIRSGKQPDCYIGISIREEFIQDWYLQRHKTLPLIKLEVNEQVKKLLEEVRDEKDWDNEIGNAIRETLNGIPAGDQREHATKWIPGH